MIRYKADNWAEVKKRLEIKRKLRSQGCIIPKVIMYDLAMLKKFQKEVS